MATNLVVLMFAASGVFAQLPAEPLAGALPDVPAVPQAMEIPQGRDFLALKQGACDAAPGGPVHRVRVLLRRWNPKLDLGGRSNCWGDELSASLTLFKVVYGSGQDGSSMDPKTAKNLADMEDDGLQEPRRPRTSPQGEILYWASKQLGKPYRMGADGNLETDCGLFTKTALMTAGVVPADFTRLADEQYRLAKLGKILFKTSRVLLGLLFMKAPSPGSLIFFRNQTSQSAIAYDGVTHVGFWVGSGSLGSDAGYVMHASSSRGVVIVPMNVADSYWVPGFGAVDARAR